MKNTTLWALLLMVVVLLIPALVCVGCGCNELTGATEPTSQITAVAFDSTSTTLSSTSTSSPDTTLGQPPTSLQSTTTAKAATTTTTKATTTTKTTLGPPPVQTTASIIQLTQPTLNLGPVVTVDPWTFFQEDDPHLQWKGPWAQWYSSKATGGGYRAVQSSASVLVKFTGQRIIFHTMQDTRNGIAKLTVDGSQIYMVDLYGESFGHMAAWVSDPLPQGTHTLLIEWTGTKNPANVWESNFIQFDAVVVYGGTLVNP